MLSTPIYDRETGSQQFRGLVMSEIHRRRLRRYKFHFSFVGNDRRPSQKSGTCRENRNALDSPDLSPSIPDDRGYLRFRVFISRQNLGQSGNSKIPDRLGFSRHMKTRLRSDMPSLTVFCQLCSHMEVLGGYIPGVGGRGVSPYWNTRGATSSPGLFPQKMGEGKALGRRLYGEAQPK